MPSLKKFDLVPREFCSQPQLHLDNHQLLKLLTSRRQDEAQHLLPVERLAEASRYRR
jgi:hypothetical protein